MKASLTSLLLATTLAGSAVAQEDKINTAKFDEGYLRANSAPAAIGMGVLRQRKTALFEKQAAAGVFDKDRYKVSSSTACVDGKAGGYSCKNVDMKGFLRHQDMGSRTRVGNDVWGMYSSCDLK
jgi:hypothetical protein